ncbi:MAG: hypothetical protein P8N40_06840 [Gammaproteobacteria bacterium]|nr:hypothetical protein [Gammaproteobacteria bacterium]
MLTLKHCSRRNTTAYLKNQKKISQELIERSKETERTEQERTMFTQAVVLTIFAWDSEGRGFSAEDVYKAFQSEDHFSAIFNSDWYLANQ